MNLETLASDPTIQKLLAALKTLLPVVREAVDLKKITLDGAVQVLEGLTGADSYAAMQTLRRISTDEQWARICDELKSEANREVLADINRRDVGVSLAWKIALMVAGAAVGL